jgi:hypothetical protein
MEEFETKRAFYQDLYDIIKQSDRDQGEHR